MSYTRDSDRATRGVGAIAAADMSPARQRRRIAVGLSTRRRDEVMSAIAQGALGAVRESRQMAQPGTGKPMVRSAAPTPAPSGPRPPGPRTPGALDHRGQPRQGSVFAKLGAVRRMLAPPAAAPPPGASTAPASGPLIPYDRIRPKMPGTAGEPGAPVVPPTPTAPLPVSPGDPGTGTPAGPKVTVVGGGGSGPGVTPTRGGMPDIPTLPGTDIPDPPSPSGASNLTTMLVVGGAAVAAYFLFARSR